MIFVPEVCVKEFSVFRSEFYDHMFSVNPYRQIPETISKKRVVTQGKLFPKAILAILGHDPFLGKIFSMGSHEIYLEIVSGKSPESRPEIAKSEKSLEKVSGITPESPPVFLEIVSGICLYGLRSP